MIGLAPAMRFDVVTIFPDMFKGVMLEGVVGRAIARGTLNMKVHDLRSFTFDQHRTVDDVPYGGGPGMVMKAEPFLLAVDQINEESGKPDAVILPSPQGKPLTHSEAVRLSGFSHVVLLCGRYEGVDERVRDAVVTEEISIGDYVLSGGELPAAVILDAVGRLVPGVVGDRTSVAEDSFVHGLFDHPHYTRPQVLKGRKVPGVLLSGHHGEIKRWRKGEALGRTLERRPDLLKSARLDEEERTILRGLRASQQKGKAGARV